MTAEKFGDMYWCVVTGNVTKDEKRIFLYADRATVNAGTLEFWRARKKEQGKCEGEPDVLLMAFAPGHWGIHYIASDIDGSPLCVEHWT